MARRVPTSPDRRISSGMPSWPFPAMARCRHCENETALYWHQAVDILIQELKDRRDHWFSILGKRQEASHHSSPTTDANGLFKMLPWRSPEPFCFCLLKCTEFPSSFIWHVCIQQQSVSVSAVSSVYMQHLPGTTGSLNSDFWFESLSNVINNSLCL